MKQLLTLSLILAVTTVLANKPGNKRFAKTKQDIHLEYECCRITYDEIREQLREGAITLEQAQELWLEHKKNEQ